MPERSVWRLERGLTGPPFFGIVAGIVKRTAAIALTALFMFSGCSSQGSRSDAAPGQAPRLTGKDIHGEYVSLQDFRGKVVLLNVWATWCGPCRQELPELRELHERWKNQGLTVVGVSVDAAKDADKVAKMAQQFRLDYPLMLDPLGKSIEAFELRGYPTSFVIGKDGTVLWRRDGIIHPGDTELTNQIQAALRLPAPPEG